tara:strand:+ start:799 stop:1437 length:639 start_codon:yes stop_codon:yes gene_type:complete
MTNPELQHIFATPLFSTTISVPDWDASLYEWKENKHNRISTQQYVLDMPELASLRRTIDASVRVFWRDFMCATCEAELAIQQSWVNITDTGAHHHRHWHTNSMYSGVLFWCDHSAPITFINPRYPQLDFTVGTTHESNSGVWQVEPKLGKLLIFPSWLEHQVETNHSGGERVSLSFNTWPQGQLTPDPTRSLDVYTRTEPQKLTGWRDSKTK